MKARGLQQTAPTNDISVEKDGIINTMKPVAKTIPPRKMFCNEKRQSKNPF